MPFGKSASFLSDQSQTMTRSVWQGLQRFVIAQVTDAGAGIKSKIAELFNVSEVNPESQNLGPNEVGQQAIDRITPNASSFDKAAPGARHAKKSMHLK